MEFTYILYSLFFILCYLFFSLSLTLYYDTYTCVPIPDNALFLTIFLLMIDIILILPLPPSLLPFFLIF